MLAPGSKFGDYLIEEVIGSGAMGVVYRAVDTRLDRTVALKLISDKLSKTPVIKSALPPKPVPPPKSIPLMLSKSGNTPRLTDDHISRWNICRETTSAPPLMPICLPAGNWLARWLSV